MWDVNLKEQQNCVNELRLFFNYVGCKLQKRRKVKVKTPSSYSLTMWDVNTGSIANMLGVSRLFFNYVGCK